MTTSASYAPYRPCCFSLFDWEEKVITDVKGKKHFRVRDKATGDVYKGPKVMGTHCGTMDSDWGIRQNFAAAAVGIVPLVPLVRIPLRLFSLLRGDFARVAYDEAKKNWDAAWIKCSEAIPNGDAPMPSLPSIHTFRCNVLLLSLRELALEIVKLTVYPLASIALLFIALWGAIVDPADGGKMWAPIERMLARGPDYLKYSLFTCKGAIFDEGRLTDFLLPCRQPDWVPNAYQWYDHLPDDTVRSDLYRIESLLRNNTALLSAIGIDVEKNLQLLRDYRNTLLPLVSETDENEVAENTAFAKRQEFLKKGYKLPPYTCIQRPILVNRQDVHRTTLDAHYWRLKNAVDALEIRVQLLQGVLRGITPKPLPTPEEVRAINALSLADFPLDIPMDTPNVQPQNGQQGA